LAKHNILIVDADPKSLRVLEVSLRKAGYSVTKAVNGADAIEKIQISVPDLIISDTNMPEMDGFAFCTKLGENDEWGKIPFIFLTAERSIEEKIRGLELGVDDYLNKPIFIREILARVSLGLQRRQKERLERRGSKTKFSGNLVDMGVVDLIQTIDFSRKTGVIHLVHEKDEGEIFFCDGKLVSASTHSREKADAVYRMLVWSSGTFEISFDNVERKDEIELSTQGLLMEGMRRLDEWGRLQEQLPSLDLVFDVDEDVLGERLGEIPDEVNTVLKIFDGQRTLMGVVDSGELGDLEALTIISKLYFEGLISETIVDPVIDVGDAGGIVGALDSGQGLDSDDSEHLEVADTEQTPHDTLRLPRIDAAEEVPPRISIAARSVGFVEALTREPPPSAPLIDDDETEVTADTSVAPAAPVEEEPPPILSVVSDETAEDKPDISDPPVEPTPIAEGAADELKRVDEEIKEEIKEEAEEEVEEEQKDKKPHVDVSSTNNTILGMKVPQGFIDRDTLPTTPPPDEVEVTAKSDDDKAARIAAALDAEAPLPSEEEKDEDPPSSDSDEDGEYFDGESYSSVINQSEPRPSSIRMGVDDEPEEEEEYEQEDDQEEEYEEEEYEDHYDEPDFSGSPAKGRRVAFLVIAVVVIGVAGFFLGPRLIKGKDFDSAPVRNPDAEKTEYKTALTVEKLVDNTTPQPEPIEKRAEAIGTDTSVAVVEPAQADSDTPLEDSPVEGADTSLEQPDEPIAIEEVGSGSKEDYEELLAKAKKAGRKAKQIALLKEALAAYPEGDKANALLATLLMEGKGTRDEALGYAKTAVATNPDNGMAWLAVGYVHQLNGDGSNSKAAYKKCAACSGPRMYVNECKRLAR
jgi:CheY-like chemotaxis protein